jgi:hypothetical protein
MIWQAFRSRAIFCHPKRQRRIYAERSDTKDSGYHLFEPASSLLK